MYENRIGSIRSRFGKQSAAKSLRVERGIPTASAARGKGVQSYTLRLFLYLDGFYV